MEVWEIIQDCELSVPGLYDKQQFMQAIEDLPAAQFNRFCREHLHLQHFYTWHHGIWVTDHIPFVRRHPNMFWQTPTIDFDEPVNFRAEE